jgi:Uma2 family endonuclease
MIFGARETGAGMATTTQLTLDEFLRLPEQEPALEYWRGRVTQKVSPQGQHGVLQLSFGSILRGWILPRKLGVVFTELRSTHSDASLVPDIDFYRRERVPRFPDGRVANVFTTPPDIAIEIRSPGQSKRQLAEKCQWFVDNGSEISLLVDPDDESVMRFRRGEAPVTLRGGDLIDLTPVLPGFELTVAALFATLLD